MIVTYNYSRESLDYVYIRMEIGMTHAHLLKQWFFFIRLHDYSKTTQCIVLDLHRTFLTSQNRGNRTAPIGPLTVHLCHNMHIVSLSSPTSCLTVT